MHRFPHIVPMDPQVCPPPLSSSQSVIGGLEKSPASVFKPGHSRSSSTGSSKQSKQSRHWEVMDDLQRRDVYSYPGSSPDLSIPGICEGYLMKKRKYPLKGWHKRYFVLEKGILKYSKTQQDIQRGKLHGSLDVSLAVMSINKKTKGIDLDAGDNIYHLKVTQTHTRIQRTPSLSRHSHRAPSVAESMAEYFDASEVITCESSSEAEASDESGLSDVTTTSNSEMVLSFCSIHLFLFVAGRRTVLPASGTDNSHIGIMSILYNNIGKDLSRISMPVALNEPLSLLQRLTEELEYSELLDIANHIDDPYERMVYVAVFSISGYAWASWRNRYKPFNPVLGETYESDRRDRGFRYISEQVSHHPPVSACHAESENFSFWQDQRWKNKFWGKSMEMLSSGLVNVSLPKYGDHYEWNKAVTCIHNVLSQERWLEHYGEVVIKNNNSDDCTCKITFVKSRYWSSDSNKNEVQGVVLDRAGEVVHRFGGLWHEGIFCDTLSTPKCIWKPNVQPDDYHQFYGFSQYARELNELTPELEAVLPTTDTRFRPDQRLLELGKVAEADKKKDEVEEKQRERRKEMTKRGEEHKPRFFREVWVTNGTYYKLRKEPGFKKTTDLDLW
uniref:Oxysterol-binding protein n=1 Tax=Gasterosteus aculeatus aculeatus TaxID=481459 RepID=G3NPV9_GASAC